MGTIPFLDTISYLDMINNFVLPILATKYGRQRNGAIPRKWWFQDGAPAHRSRAVTQKLTELFQNRIVALNQVHEWPPRSPDMTPCDFFLWGYLKNKVFQTVPPSLAVLEQRIRHEITSLRRTRMVRRAVAAMHTKAEECIRRRGGQVR